MNELIWTESNGVHKATAHGFGFMIKESPVNSKLHSTLFIDVAGSVAGSAGYDRIFSRRYFGATLHKEMAQSFADAVQSAIDKAVNAELTRVSLIPGSKSMTLLSKALTQEANSLYEEVDLLKEQLVSERAKVELCRKLLQEHHEWHLNQGVQDDTLNGLDMTEEYADSDFYERTQKALSTLNEPVARNNLDSEVVVCKPPTVTSVGASLSVKTAGTASESSVSPKCPTCEKLAEALKKCRLALGQLADRPVHYYLEIADEALLQFERREVVK